MNKNAVGLRIRQEKDNVNPMYNKGTILQDIANEYNVAVSTIHRYLRKWGIPVKRKAYKRKVRGLNKYKRKFSEEFLAKQMENTAINSDNKCFKYFSRDDTKSEIDRIRSITKQKVNVI